MSISAVIFDVGETLVDESSAWERVARQVEVPPFTFMATLGGLIARGEHHSRVFGVLGTREAAVEFTPDDFYPDALPCLRRLCDAGYFVGVVGNTTRAAEDLVRPYVSFVASSAAWGVEKPSSAFFERLISACGRPADEIAYVGDRVDNDVVPALAAGLVAVQIRRGPWAYLHDSPSDCTTIMGLDELPAALR